MMMLFNKTRIESDQPDFSLKIIGKKTCKEKISDEKVFDPKNHWFEFFETVQGGV